MAAAQDRKKNLAMVETAAKGDRDKSMS